MTLRQQIGQIKHNFFQKLDKALPANFDAEQYISNREYEISAEAKALFNELNDFDRDFNTKWYDEYMAMKRGLK